MTPLWRRPFDAIERPLTAASESLVQSETVMDLAAVAFRVQRRVAGALQRRSEQAAHALGLLSRGDVLDLSNQVARLERQVRDLRGEIERHDEFDHLRSGARNGRAAEGNADNPQRARARGGT